MEAKVAHTLIRFATARENAYRIAGALSGAKAASITKIKQVANYVLNRPAEVQLQAVKQIEPEIRLILPHPESRFQKMRRQVLHLLDLSHAQTV